MEIMRVVQAFPAMDTATGLSNRNNAMRCVPPGTLTCSKLTSFCAACTWRWAMKGARFARAASALVGTAKSLKQETGNRGDRNKDGCLVRHHKIGEEEVHIFQMRSEWNSSSSLCCNLMPIAPKGCTQMRLEHPSGLGLRGESCVPPVLTSKAANRNE